MGARLALTLAVLSALGGCAAILGVDDLTYLGPEGGLDAASEASGDAGDAGAQDAPCEAAVATDPKNCGGCGHDCLGGGCEAGVCQPVLVTTGSGLVTLASDGTTLFLRDSAAIHACPVTGCADAGTPLSPVTIVTPSPKVRITGNDVVWNEGSHLYSCAKTGCSPQTDLLQSAGNTYPVVAVWISDYVFWISQANSGVGPFAYRIGKCPLGGGVCTNITFGASDYIGSLTGVGFDVYWTHQTQSLIRYCQGSCGVDASTADTTALTGPTDLLADGTALWAAYLNGTSGGVARLRTDLTGAAPFATSPFVTRIVKDSAALYFLEASKRQLQRCTSPDDAGTCNPAVLYQGGGNLTDLAMDGAALYWIEDQANVWRLAR